MRERKTGFGFRAVPHERSKGCFALFCFALLYVLISGFDIGNCDNVIYNKKYVFGLCPVS
jgi:hypothetical protein